MGVGRRGTNNQDHLFHGGGPVHTLSYRVIYADTDAGKVVYYGAYMRLFEMGRAEYLRDLLGKSYSDFLQQGILFPVIELQCRYHRPARYDDLLSISTSVEAITGATIRFGYQITRKAGEELIVTGHTVHAAVSEDGRPRRLPEEISRKLGKTLHLED